MKIEISLNDYLAMIRQLGFCLGALESMAWVLEGSPSPSDLAHLAEAGKRAAGGTKEVLDRLNATPPALPPRTSLSGTGTER